MNSSTYFLRRARCSRSSSSACASITARGVFTAGIADGRGASCVVFSEVISTSVVPFVGSMSLPLAHQRRLGRLRGDGDGLARHLDLGAGRNLASRLELVLQGPHLRLELHA